MRGSEPFPWTPASRWLTALLVSSAVAAQGYYGLAPSGVSPVTRSAARTVRDHLERSTVHRGTRVAERAGRPDVRGEERSGSARSRNQTLALLLLAAEGSRSAVLR